MKEHKDNIEEKVKEFDERFCALRFGDGTSAGGGKSAWLAPKEGIGINEMRGFLRSALTETYAQARREAIEECVEALPERTERDCCERSLDRMWGWNSCLKEARAALEKLKNPQ